MTLQASTAGFRGSDTDVLDKIVNKMNDAAAFADKMVMALKALCAALDAMSWTGYAAALAAYLRSTVIPLLQTVSRNLKLFAKIVGLASSVQKDTSSNRYIIDAGDTGYVPVPIGRPAPPAVGDPATPIDERPDSGSDQGAVEANTLDIEKLKSIVGDVASIYNKVQELIELADGDGVGDGTIGQQLTKLGEIVSAIENLIGGDGGDAGGDTGGDSGGEEGSTGGGRIDDGTIGITDPGNENPISITDPGADQEAPAGSGVTVGQIWQALTGALRELGLLSDDGSVGDTGAIGFDRDAVAGEIDSIQNSLDNLRESLGIEPVTTDPGADSNVYPSDGGAGYHAGEGLSADQPSGGSYTAEPLSYAEDPMASGLRPDTAGDTTYESGYSAGYEAGYSVGSEESFRDSAVLDQQSYQAESSPAGSGAGTGGGGSGSGDGSLGGGSGGGSDGSGGGAYAPEQAAAAAGPASEQEQVVYHSRSVGSVGDGPSVEGSGEVQSRLVAMASEPTSGAGAAIPLSGAAVAASLLGGMYARRARSQDGQEGDAAEGDEAVFEAVQNPA